MKHCYRRRTARRAVSVKILSTAATSCTTNRQQMEVMALEGYSHQRVINFVHPATTRSTVVRAGVINKLDRRRRRRVLLTTRSTPWRIFPSTEFMTKFHRGKYPNFLQIPKFPYSTVWDRCTQAFMPKHGRLHIAANGVS